MTNNFLVNRETKETKSKIRIDFNDNLNFININTGIPFFDHLLSQIPFHGCFSCEIICKGDIDVDTHHSIEDIGIVFGKILKKIFKEKKKKRFFFSCVPMDESLTRMTMDICDRPSFVFNVKKTKEKIKGVSLSNIKEFFKSVCYNSKICLHVDNYGEDFHHRIESMFKCFGVLLKKTFSIKRNKIYKLSTKDL
ncbi:Imidazoleglycerol-phosphate dehydratase [Candidatus Vidania fulgoroideae]|nr:Imidazoleglycerol-phosphate dehydratase [Candidatus Vidania fulgoroideae]